MEKPSSGIGNHHHDSLIKHFAVAEVAENKGISETIQFTPFLANQGMVPICSLSWEPTAEWNHQCLDVDQIPPTMLQIQEILHVAMMGSQAL